VPADAGARPVLGDELALNLLNLMLLGAYLLNRGELARASPAAFPEVSFTSTKKYETGGGTCARLK
jgi:hypothetical protein